jgi:hypothetical protein
VSSYIDLADSCFQAVTGVFGLFFVSYNGHALNTTSD